MATFDNLSKQWQDNLLVKEPEKPLLNSGNFAKTKSLDFSISNFGDNTNKLLTDNTNNFNQNKLLTGNNTTNPAKSNPTNVPDYNRLLDQYSKEYEKSLAASGEKSDKTYRAKNDLDKIKINNFLLQNGYDLNDINFDNLNFDNYGKIADNIKDPMKKNEWLELGHIPLMSRQFRGMSEGLKEFSNNMNNIQKDVYDLRNQLQPPISPYNQQQISPDEYQKQRQQKWGNLPPVSSSVYDRLTKPSVSTDDYTAYAKRISAGRRKITNNEVSV